MVEITARGVRSLAFDLAAKQLAVGPVGRDGKSVAFADGGTVSVKRVSA